MEDKKDSLELLRRCKEATRLTEDQSFIKVRQSKHSTQEEGHLQQHLQYLKLYNYLDGNRDSLEFLRYCNEAARFIGDRQFYQCLHHKENIFVAAIRTLKGKRGLKGKQDS